MSTKVFDNARVLIFAREPVSGEVKTRMQPHLSAAEALALHKALLTHVIGTVRNSNLCNLELWVSSNPRNEYFLSLCNVNEIYEQAGDDLGARMAHAARSALHRASYVILLGSDCPSVDATYLQEALKLLQQGENIVFGPAEDGGYVMLGLRTVPDVLFEDMPWGSPEVMALTRQRLQAVGERWRELAYKWDVDTPEDLPKLHGILPGW